MAVHMDIILYINGIYISFQNSDIYSVLHLLFLYFHLWIPYNKIYILQKK